MIPESLKITLFLIYIGFNTFVASYVYIQTKVKSGEVLSFGEIIYYFLFWWIEFFIMFLNKLYKIYSSLLEKVVIYIIEHKKETFGGYEQ